MIRPIRCQVLGKLTDDPVFSVFGQSHRDGLVEAVAFLEAKTDLPITQLEALRETAKKKSTITALVTSSHVGGQHIVSLDVALQSSRKESTFVAKVSALVSELDASSIVKDSTVVDQLRTFYTDVRNKLLDATILAGDGLVSKHEAPPETL